MTKKDLIKAVVADTHLTLNQATAAVEAVLLNIIDLSCKGSLQLRGFGTYRVVTQEAREVRNPKTGKPVQVAEKRVLKFKASKK